MNDLPPALVARLGSGDLICGSEPPGPVAAPDGSMWLFGDCWCTLPPDHPGLCYCEICTHRHQAPGWGLVP